MTAIRYTPELSIKNTKMLAPGLGLHYLACINSHVPGELIAKKWYRDMPQHEEIVVVFGMEPISAQYREDDRRQHKCPSCGGQCRCDAPREYCVHCA